MMRLQRLNGLLLVAVLAGSGGIGLAGCKTNVPARVQINDAAITASVKTKLAADPEVAAHNIDVDTNQGVVTLSGHVDTREASQEAEKLARQTDGVLRVINNLTVGDQTGR